MGASNMEVAISNFASNLDFANRRDKIHRQRVWVRLALMMLLAWMGIGTAVAQYSCSGDYANPDDVCDTEGEAHLIAIARCDSFVAANPMHYSYPNKCGSPYVYPRGSTANEWRVSLVSGANLYFRGYYLLAASCSTQPSRLSPGTSNGPQCINGCEYTFANNGDGTSTGHPSGATCPLPYFDPGKNNECCKTDNAGSPTGPIGVGNPVNMFVGNKTEVVQDYVDPKGHLGFARYYSSANIPLNPGTTLGVRWRHTYQASVVPSPPYNYNLNRVTGNSYTFRQSGNLWLPDKDVSDRLAAVMSGSTRVGWTATTSNNVVERYDATGKLIQIEYPDGDLLQASYDAQNRLSRLSDRRGRALVLAYVNNLLDSLTLPDGRVLKYSYDSQQRLVAVAHHADVASPPLTAVQYRYEDPNDAKLLTGIIDASNQRYATWGYDAAGRAISSYHGSGVDQVTIGYGADRSTVTGPLGAPVEYGYQLGFGRAKLISGQKLCPSCSSQSFQNRTYDANGYPDKLTDFSGAVTNNDYSSRGLLTQSIQSENNAATKRTIQTDWHTTLPVPIERRTYDAVGVLVQKEVWTYNSRGQVLTHVVSDL